MNEDHSLDTAIRQVVTEQLDQQPAPVAWDEIDVGHTITWDTTTSGDRRWLLGAAAALILLLGAGMLWLRPGDPREAEPPASADPIEAPGAIALSQVDQLTDDQWVVPTQLPEGFELKVAMAAAAERSVSYGGAAYQTDLSITIFDPQLVTDHWATDDGRHGTGLGPEAHKVDEPGTALAWTVHTTPGAWRADLVGRELTLKVNAPGPFDQTAVAMLDSLVVLHTSDLPHPPIDFDDPAGFTRVASGGGATLSVAWFQNWISPRLSMMGTGTTCCQEISDDTVAFAAFGGSSGRDGAATMSTAVWAMARPNVDSLMIDIPGDGHLLADLSEAEIHDGWKYWVTTEELPREPLENGPDELPVQAFDADGNLIE